MQQSPSKLNIWLQTARLRTLPLSFSGIISGAALAQWNETFDFFIFSMCLWCTLLFQVISNFANDYGDGVKGTDNENRIGPKRSIQSGLLSALSLKKAIILLSILAFVSVIILLVYVFGWHQWPLFVLFLFLGAFSIWAAIRYTVGDKAYGYQGLGDVFVFIFFGVLGVVGAAFLFTLQVHALYFLPALVIGCLSVAVLNLNNMRDHKNDQNFAKNTLVVRYGYAWAKKYQLCLVLLAITASALLSFFTYQSWIQCLPLLVFVFLIVHLKTVFSVPDPKKLDPELKKVAILTFLWAVLFMISSINLL
ncbi:MAG: 1,4-dihydroxy-2-naphthoate octaprenyltransferase [Flavobacteriaceae bacterium]